MMLVVSAITFTLLSSAGGDALTALRDNPQISPETVERLRTIYGFDRPLLSRYGSWLAGSFAGDMGESFYFKVPVTGLVLSRLKNTFLLGFTALFIAVAVAASLAFLAVRFPFAYLDGFVNGVTVLAASLPRIVLSLFALALIISTTGSAIDFSGDSIGLFFISALVMAVPLFSIFLTQMHGGITTAMKEQFVLLARAKGLSEGSIILRHASRAALNPVLSIFGLSLGSIVSGSVIVETILGWPGLGALTVAAIRGRDVALVMGIVVVSSIAIWFGNAVAEVLQLLNDKRMLSDELKNA